MAAIARVPLLGSGGLGREVVISAKRLGEPAVRVADAAEVSPMPDGAEIAFE